MKNRLVATSIALWLLAMASQSALAIPSATEQVKDTVDTVLALLGDKSLDRQTKRAKMKAVISARFDFENMSRRTLAKNWKPASEAQRARFVKNFTEILANTYLVAIEAYTEEIIEFTGEKVQKEKYAQVDTLIVRDDVKTPVNYKLQLKGEEWLAYDVVIEGVSLIRNFRGSYQSIIKKEGIDGLLTRMDKKVKASALD